MTLNRLILIIWSCDLAENRVSNVMKESDNENTVKADLDQDAML